MRPEAASPIEPTSLSNFHEPSSPVAMSSRIELAAEDIDEIDAVGALVVERALPSRHFVSAIKVKSRITETPASATRARRSSRALWQSLGRILSEISGLGERRRLPLLANPAALRYEGGGNFGQPAVADGEGRQSRSGGRQPQKRLFDQFGMAVDAMFRAIANFFRRIGFRRFILVLVVLFCGLLVWFNFFRTKMIGEFFANMQAPSVAVSATKVEPTTWKPEIRRDRHALGDPGRRRRDAGRRRRASRSTSPPTSRSKQGELLVQIDDAVERADLMSAQAAVERDRTAQLERALSLRKTRRQLRRGRWRRRRARSPLRSRRSQGSAPCSTRSRSRRRLPA